jgi:SulP family sulfate permease
VKDTDDAPSLRRYLPIFDWGRRLRPRRAVQRPVAAVIVTIMLIPQSLAYALLAGLPPRPGLYASIAPIMLYAIFGTSRALAVGPVAVVSLMTAAAIGRWPSRAPPELCGGGADAGLPVGGFLLC